MGGYNGCNILGVVFFDHWNYEADMKLAIIQDWLTTYSGSERVIEQILQVYPDADLFCMFDVMSKDERSFLNGREVTTSFLQKLPFINSHYRHFLPLMPIAVEQFDLSAYDVVVSNCHATSKGVITSPEQLHISYIHTPIRYAWDMQNEYLKASRPGAVTNILMRAILHYIRQWDMVASQRPDIIFANSGFIARRIRKIYRREARVLYPPVDTESFPFQGRKDDYYLTVSRLVPYKRVDLIMEAFHRMPDKKLVVIGDGPDRKKIQKMTASNIQWLGYQPVDVVRRHMQNARAFIFAAKEDFGITPLEAQACGTPVIGYKAGGLAETVKGLEDTHPTGVFFSEQTSRSIQEAVTLFETVSERIELQMCRKNAERFSNSRFKNEFCGYLDSAWNEFQKKEA